MLGVELLDLLIDGREVMNHRVMLWTSHQFLKTGTGKLFLLQFYLSDIHKKGLSRLQLIFGSHRNVDWEHGNRWYLLRREWIVGGKHHFFWEAYLIPQV